MRSLRIDMAYHPVCTDADSVEDILTDNFPQDMVFCLCKRTKCMVYYAC